MKIRLNENFSNLKESYLFSDIAKRIRAYSAEHPEKAGRLIRLGIGDVTLPLTPTVIAAMHRATDEMADKSTFRGYAPEYGYDFLRPRFLPVTAPRATLATSWIFSVTTRS